jgi:hypothetical protein
MDYNQPYKKIWDTSDSKVYFSDKPLTEDEGYAKAVNIYLVREVDKDSTVFDYTSNTSFGMPTKFLFVAEKSKEVFKNNRGIARTQDIKAVTSYYCLMEVAPELVVELNSAKPANTSKGKNNTNLKSEEK